MQRTKKFGMLLTGCYSAGIGPMTTEYRCLGEIDGGGQRAREELVFLVKLIQLVEPPIQNGTL